ncbi:hypothetical protein CPARA_3gp343 (nucleomorph) [Cryptomonas paramecium]|uniref:Uncharacterized protein n=1 Tax=Cryptomonas paramaecium TaxID=2898 RepID=F2HI77_9CRYP|nr:hypothetical protein CPARA_3gp343 [Cryptomonas paramecium]AEA39001.1 hypothetical protein CPARA_3gp343 [Cryptomonas paramecium]
MCMKKAKHSVGKCCYFFLLLCFLKKYSFFLKKYNEENLNTSREICNFSFKFLKIGRSSILFELLNFFCTKVLMKNHILLKYNHDKKILSTNVKLFFLFFFKLEFLKKRYFFFLKKFT